VYFFGAGAKRKVTEVSALYGWKGRWSRGDEPDWFAGASRFHDYNRGLHLLLRKQEDLSEGPVRGSEGSGGARRKNHGHKVWRQNCHAYAGICPLGAPAIQLPGTDGHDFELGLNDETVLTLAKATKNERFAWDCYRRFIQMYGDVVMNVQKRANEDHEPFEV